MADCIFCKISASELDTEFVYEDGDIVCFKDISPKAATHLLIVPKKHIDSVANAEEEDVLLLGKLLLSAKKIADRLGLKGYRLQFNVGKDGGQEVFHIHLHLLSKFSS